MLMRLLITVRRGLRRPYLLLALAASLALLSTACYNIGVENSWMRVQNTGTAAATVEVQYYDTEGRMVASDRSLPIQPGEGWTFVQKDNPTLPQGFLGSGVIIADQPIAVPWPRTSTRAAASTQPRERLWPSTRAPTSSSFPL